jgi:ATP/maltotriose-dependent transcriptional regulator MalT
VLTALINVLCETRSTWALILDDYHVIHEPEIHQSLIYLLDYLPPTVHIFLASRTQPPFPLSRWRGRSKMLEVQAGQLRATVEEVQQLVHSMKHIAVQDSIVQEMVARTEGWWALIHLLCLTLPWEADPCSIVKEIHDSNLYILDYVTEVVLPSLEPAVSQFLLHSSLLSQFTAGICDAVLERTDSRMMLEALEFTYQLAVPQEGQGRCYRYPALMAEVLQTHLARMDEEEAQMLHVRASGWYEQHGNLPEAIHHAMCAHAWTRAVELVETITQTSSELPSEAAMILDWLEQLPAEVAQARAHLWQYGRQQQSMPSVEVMAGADAPQWLPGQAEETTPFGMESPMKAGVFGSENQSCPHEPIQLQTGMRMQDTVSREHNDTPPAGHPCRPDQRAAEQPLFEALSEREQQVLQELVHGASNQEIADRLTITVATVKRHVSNVFAKLQAHNRTHAVVQARTYGLFNAAV